MCALLDVTAIRTEGVLSNVEIEVKARRDDLQIFVGWSDERKTYYMRVILLTPNADVKEWQVAEVGYDGDIITDLTELDMHVRKVSKAHDGLSPAEFKRLFDAEPLTEDAGD